MTPIYTDEDSEVWLNLVVLNFITEKKTANSYILSLIRAHPFHQWSEILQELNHGLHDQHG